jgi:hypothetical protein
VPCALNDLFRTLDFVECLNVIHDQILSGFEGALLGAPSRTSDEGIPGAGVAVPSVDR